MADRAKDRLVEVAMKGVGPEKFDRQSGRADKRAQYPANLAAEEEIAGQPRKQDSARYEVAAAQGPQQAQQANIRHDAGKCDHDHLRELDKVVGHPGNLRLCGQRRCVPDDEKHDRRE